VPRNPLDELFLGLSDVLKTLTEGEKLWAKRLRELRSTQGDLTRSDRTLPKPSRPLSRPSPVSDRPVGAAPNLAGVAPNPVGVAPNPVGVAPNPVPVGANRLDPRAADTAPLRDAQWPTVPGSEVADSAVGKRDYDFFAELDEKLNALQKPGIGSSRS
jgi:hypothetical protein